MNMLCGLTLDVDLQGSYKKKNKIGQIKFILNYMIYEKLWGKK